MKILCTICARKGSEGLKGKNYKKLHGVPLIDYTIDQALRIKEINNIIISVDNYELKKRKNNKITYLSRPKSLSGNKIGKVKVIRHALKYSEKTLKKNFDLILDLDVTSPLRNISDIKNSIKMIKKNRNANNLLTICPARKNPYFNMVEKKGLYYNLVKSNNKIVKRRQDAPKVFEMNASIYLWKKKYLLKSDKLFSKKTVFYKMPYNRSIDIDSVVDFELVKILWKLRK